MPAAVAGHGDEVVPHVRLEADVDAEDDGMIPMRLRARTAALIFIIPADDEQKLTGVRAQHERIRHLMNPANAKPRPRCAVTFVARTGRSAEVANILSHPRV